MPLQAHKLTQAETLLREGKADQARTLLQRLLQQGPNDAEANRLMSIALSTLGQLDQSLFYAKRAAAGRPGDASLVVAVGNLEYNLGRSDEAMACFRRALQVDPACAEAREAVVDLHFQLARFADAEAECRAGLAQTPGHPVLSTTLAAVLLNTGRGAESMETLTQSAKLRPFDQVVAAGRAQASLYVDGCSPEEILALHKQFGVVLGKILPEGPARRIANPDPERPIRIGLLSADFRQHSVAFFLEPLLEHLDREKFRVLCYHTILNEDAVTARFKSLADEWRNVATRAIEDTAAQVVADQVDILIDLAGHTDASHLAAFHLRPAPIQISYLAYAATTGLPAMDYRIVDSVTDPPGSEAYSTERLLRLDPCFLCYRPLQGAPEVGPGPAALGEPVTFGSFNVLQKVNEPLMSLWKEILDAVPQSRLLLKTQGFNQQPIRDQIAERLTRVGIAREQFELLPWIPSGPGHLAAYGRVDIALDTHPYNGTTTTCEALFMGVPVITLAGRHHASRVGASILSAIGCPELVAESREAYVQRAAELARDPARRAELRLSLRRRLISSPLCDAPGLALRFGRMLRQVWRERCLAQR